ncbi:hypothetical protein DAPPUDRAFT_328071 [Daphnia pulex]|uniref:Syndecan/Neurexin domain-containing protein n=1 Tax=Daphnia pulex TaxID=6669 RepID=E9HCP3_DAPPU|nr:hypothetical protein DAPPUDRAFT_328071 [Daphnia pulex]|eukprot:EFX70509.1 hypothetical protein DAPPUDRAFT_328071 [Daphnia pulex]
MSNSQFQSKLWICLLLAICWNWRISCAAQDQAGLHHSEETTGSGKGMPSNDDLIDYDFDNPEDYREIDYDSSHNPILGMVRSSSSHPISLSLSCLSSLIVIFLHYLF